MITLRMGSRDPHVVFLQRLLNNALVHDRSVPILEEDGAFGQLTLTNVYRFQNTYAGAMGRLNPDGVVGPATWRALGLTVEISHYLPTVGQMTGMSCWVVSGGLATGRMTSAIPGGADVDPTNGGLNLSMDNVQQWASSLNMRLVHNPPATIEGIEPLVRRGPVILVGKWIAGGAHAVVISGYYAGPSAYAKMLRINNSLPVGRGCIQLTDYPSILLGQQGMTAFALLTR